MIGPVRVVVERDVGQRSERAERHRALGGRPAVAVGADDVGDRIGLDGLVREAVLEPEGMEVGTFGDTKYIFVNEERSSLVAVFPQVVWLSEHKEALFAIAGARSRNASTDMAPRSPSSRERTPTVPCSRSRSPRISMYGTFCS